MKQIFLVRHVEAKKTLEERHGGDGTPITEQGRDDVSKIADYIRGQVDESLRKLVIASPVPQVHETAALLGAALGWQIKSDVMLKGMKMGIFAGLTNDETIRLDPQAAHRLSLWRQGKLPVDEIKIPGAEDIIDFQKRIASVLLGQLEDYDVLVVCVTRSTGIAALNLLTSGLESRTENYIRFRFDPGSISLVVARSPGQYQIIEINRTSHLGRVINYPDD